MQCHTLIVLLETQQQYGVRLRKRQGILLCDFQVMLSGSRTCHLCTSKNLLNVWHWQVHRIVVLHEWLCLVWELLFQEAGAMVQKKLPIPAYQHLLKLSHCFNVLDARGAIGVTQRAKCFATMRRLAKSIAGLSWIRPFVALRVD